MKKIVDFFKDEEGLAMAEYAVLLTLIAIALFVTIGLFRTAIQNAFETATETLGGGGGE